MLPRFIKDLCIDGEQKDYVLNWLHRKTSDMPDFDDKWIICPSFNYVSAHVFKTPSYACAYLFALHGHSIACQQVVNNTHTYRCAIRGAAEGNHLSLLVYLCANCPYELNPKSDIISGACRGNNLNILSQFMGNRQNIATNIIDVFDSKRGLELMQKFFPSKSISDSFRYACLTHDFSNIQGLWDQIDVHDKLRHLDELIIPIIRADDIQLLVHLMQLSHHEACVKQFVCDCFATSVECGSEIVVDWLLYNNYSFDVMRNHFSRTIGWAQQVIEYGNSHLLKKIWPTQPIRLSKWFVPTYLNFGGLVQSRFDVDTRRNQTQKCVLKSLSLTLIDKRLIQCMISNVISFE